MWGSTTGCIVTLILSLLAVSLAAEAQPPLKVYRIGWLDANTPPSRPDPSIEAFQQALRDLGYVEGQTIVIEYRWAEGRQTICPIWRPSL